MYSIEPESMYKTMIEKFIQANQLEKQITVINKHIDHITTDDLDGRKVIDIVVVSTDR